MDASTPRKRRARKILSCTSCRASKLRCDRALPCGNCRRKNSPQSCTFDHHASKAQATPHHNTSPEASGDSTLPDRQAQQHSPRQIDCWEESLQRPDPGGPSPLSPTIYPSLTLGSDSVVDALLDALPPKATCDYLASRYFTGGATLFPILHGPTFQKHYASFWQAPTEAPLSCRALVLVVCSVSLNTLWGDNGPGTRLLGLEASTDCPAKGFEPLMRSRKLRSAALMCLSRDQFLVKHDLTTLEALLILLYIICHDEGVERAWALLGTTLNIALALRCNVDDSGPSDVERERRKRCWAGVLLLHTYQGLVFRDIDMTFLIKLRVDLPAKVNAEDIHRDNMVPFTSRMSLFHFKIRLFELSTEVCRAMMGGALLSEQSLGDFNAAIAAEQQEWDRTYLNNGEPSILDMDSYAQWSVLQTYAHQLLLLLHRPRQTTRSPHHKPESQAICLESALALLHIHQEFFESPRLQAYRWLLMGMTSFNALQAVVCMTASLLDMPGQVDVKHYRDAIDKAAASIESLQPYSLVCSRAMPVMHRMQSDLDTHYEQPFNTLEPVAPDWLEQLDWLASESDSWKFWDNVLNAPGVPSTDAV